MGPVGGVSGQIPPAALPADSGVCVGLAVCSLLDVSLRHRQHHAAVRAGGLRLVETVVSSGLQVQAAVTSTGVRVKCSSKLPLVCSSVEIKSNVFYQNIIRYSNIYIFSAHCVVSVSF